jgi:hypothetical protein
LYSELEKIAYAVVMATRKLKHFFEAHKVTVLTDQPLNDLFINMEPCPEYPNGQLSYPNIQLTLDKGQRSSRRFWPTLL